MADRGPDLGPAARITADGGLRLSLPGHDLLYFPRSLDTLVVTFDPRMKVYPDVRTREPWAGQFVARYGVSSLHVMPARADWYRDADLEACLTELSARGFFAAFGSVMTYGGSMGGFAALAFAGVTGADRVLSINPQVNLGPQVRTWETRWPEAARLDWNSPTSDVNAQLAGVRLPVLVYDPRYHLDRKQADLVHVPHAARLHVPFVGHRMPGHLQSLRMLAPLFVDVLGGRVNPRHFHIAARRRRTLTRYKEMLLHLSRHDPARKARIERLLPWDGLVGQRSLRVIDDEE